ncbi:MAG: alginate lyase family protein, partial [Muribaculaceae bacterium]|nr:alginate lyase family protein [Muribaculaceae bacterium]
MKRIISLLSLAAAICLMCAPARAERTFVHPGCSYTQGQLDRMKAMVEAKQEPYYTTFLNLKNSEHADLSRKVTDRGNQIKEGSFNGTVGIDGRCAHDLALLWHLTGDSRYADKAVEYLNANSHYTNTSARGTGPLDNGKVNLLIEAAELMRDYDGWAADDQQRFKDMLTYPYYSTTEDVYSLYASSDDSQNRITFYWNIYNGDASRYGNQGMFGMLAMLAMGVYLDNEVIYDRALRYISGLPHRPDDLPYVSGPALTSKNPTDKGEYQNTYSLEGRKKDIEDYGYDELLEYYFYPNGQCQESSRDQGHVLCGLHKFIEFAEIAWNQGDQFYSLLDNRLLKGIEFNYRYNLSSFLSFPDQPQPWEPAGYTSNWDEVTLENNMYLQTRSRSGRWESIKPSPDGRGGISNVGSRESAYAHYLVRAGESDENTLWLRRAHDYTLDKYGYETSGTAPNWFYEWNGWGTLTKTLGTWMAGDPVTFNNGERISGIHTLPGKISAADYDYYNISEDGEGHTYHKVAAAAASAYRPDGGVALILSDGKWVVTDANAGEWLNYTVSCPLEDSYDVYVTYKANEKSKIGVAVSGGDEVSESLDASASFVEKKIGSVMFPAGASVIRLYVDEAGDGLEIASIRVAYNAQGEPSVDFSGYLDSKSKTFFADWEFSGVLAQNVNLVRTDAKGKEEVVSANNTLGHFEDTSIDGGMAYYTYTLKYSDGSKSYESEPVVMEWGKLDDTFANEDVAEWKVLANNGTGSFSESVYNVALNASGAARVSRNWSFPFHAGNYPILAFRMNRADG